MKLDCNYILIASNLAQDISFNITGKKVYVFHPISPTELQTGSGGIQVLYKEKRQVYVLRQTSAFMSLKILTF